MFYENKSIFDNLVVCVGYPVWCSLTSTLTLLLLYLGSDKRLNTIMVNLFNAIDKVGLTSQPPYCYKCEVLKLGTPCFLSPFSKNFN